MNLIIHKDLTYDEIHQLSDKVVGDAYIPIDVDPRVMYVYNEDGNLELFNRKPIYLEAPKTSTNADRLMSNIGWLKATPSNQDHTAIVEGLGIKFGNLQDAGAGINHPNYFLHYEDGDLLALQHSGEPKTFSQDGVLTGTLSIGYGSPKTYADRQSGATGGDYDASTGLLAIAMYGYHMVRVWKKEEDGTFAHQYDIGDGGLSYNPFEDSHKLAYPRDCKWVDGKLLLSCYRGRISAGDENQGYLGIYDNVAGTMTPFTLEIKNPLGLVLTDSSIYVSEAGSSKVIRLALGNGEIEQEYTIGDVGIRGYGAVSIGLIDDGATLLRCNDRQQLIAQDTSTGATRWVKDANKDEFAFHHSGNWAYGNFLQLDNGNYVMGDFSRNVCSFDTTLSSTVVPYLLSIDAEQLALLLEEFEIIKVWGNPHNTTPDIEELTLYTPIKRIKEVDDILLELRRK